MPVWPDNREALALFLRMGRQWRAGMGGAYALDFNVLYRMMDRMGLTPERYDALEADIAVLEGAALDAMSER